MSLDSFLVNNEVDFAQLEAAWEAEQLRRVPPERRAEAALAALDGKLSAWLRRE